MSSGPPASHKRRLRFHFHHQPEPEGQPVEEAQSPRLSADEILTSLRRRPGDAAEESGVMENDQGEEFEEGQEGGVSHVLRDAITKKIHHRRGFAFFLLFCASSAILYEMLKPRYNLPSITSLTIDLGTTIFSSLLVQIGVASLIGILLILRVSRRRKSHTMPSRQ
ncbi:MAG TPA: hypothetical protein VFE98_05105 [Candidatus Bathyarchaeia archaeon]|nr:hypothetical protein [Candidatus Bathyarchaeia archaeon]